MRPHPSNEEAAVLSVFARLANHEVLQEHQPRRPLNCSYCELAQMFENMMVGQLKAASKEAGRHYPALAESVPRGQHSATTED